MSVLRFVTFFTLAQGLFGLSALGDIFAVQHHHVRFDKYIGKDIRPAAGGAAAGVGGFLGYGDFLAQAAR